MRDLFTKFDRRAKDSLLSFSDIFKNLFEKDA
jgi:hypothetical protein